MEKYKKVAELTGEDSTKVKGYFSELYGEEYAKAMVTNYKPDGEQKKVEAGSKIKAKQ